MGRIYRQGQTKPCFIYRLFTAGSVEEVIYQRQSQKGGLATLTVDAGTTTMGEHKKSTSENAAKFTKEELADCFTLKVGCSCDTKEKIGSGWPAYDDGADGLRALGCADAPLLSVAESMTETLLFVRLASDDETLCKASPPADEEATPTASSSEDANGKTEMVEDCDDFDSENEF